ncbi:MAG: PqqD family protein [Polyangiaceae bacterium]
MGDSDPTAFEIVDDVFARAFDGELVVLALAEGQYYGLDPIGARVWRAIEEGTPLSSLVSVLVTEYEVERSVLESDIRDLLVDLHARGLVRPKSAADAASR